MGRRVTLVTVLLAAAVSAGSAHATSPGAPGRVVFSADGDLHTVVPGSPAVTNLTATAGVEEAQAAWSPDGSRMAFRVGTAGTSDVLQIAVMNADGSGRTVVTSGDQHSTQPSWSPDGRRIVFRRSVPGVNLSGDVWVMDASGSSPQPLLALPGDERYPSLSPDGTGLSLTTRPSAGDDVEIAVANADGSGPAVVTDNAIFDSAPSWSPDGQRLAFERGPAGDDPGNDVWSMTPDGADQRQLTTTAGLDEGPVWSPDGARIVFTSTRAGTSDIWTMGADGGDPQPLTTLPGKEESPDWQALPFPPPAGGPAPSPPAPPAGGTAPSSQALAAPRAALRLTRGQSLRTARRGGLALSLTCARACLLDARVLLDRSTARRLLLARTGPLVIGRATRRLRAAMPAKLTIRLGPRTRRALAGTRRVTITLRITTADGAERRTIARRVTLTRTGAALRG